MAPADGDGTAGDALPVPVTYDDRRGLVYVLGQPAWIMSPEFYMDLQNQLEILSGRAAKGILYRVTFAAGQRSARQLAGPLTPSDDLDERLQQVNDFTSLTGFGRYAFSVTDATRTETCWVLEDSVIARLHAPSREAVCHVYTGFLAGWLSVLFDRPVECVETECRAKGDARCVFRTKPARALPI